MRGPHRVRNRRYRARRRQLALPVAPGFMRSGGCRRGWVARTVAVVADSVDSPGRVAHETPAPFARGLQLSKSLWKDMLPAGVVIGLFATLVTALTQDDILAPTVILVDSFLV